MLILDLTELLPAASR